MEQSYSFKMNYNKAIDHFFSEIGYLINMIVNTSSEDQFNWYIKEILMIGQENPSLTKLVKKWSKSNI